MIDEIVPVNVYSGNSSVTKFDFDFLINYSSELIVYHTDINGVQKTLELNIDYSINEIGNKNGSYIIFPLTGSSYTVLSEGEKLSLCLELPCAQIFPFGTSEKLKLISLETALDYIVRLIQIIKRQTDRSVKVQEGSDITSEELVSELFEAKNTAVEKAQVATTQASAAATSAANALSSETSAAASASSALSSAQTATTQAQIATTKASAASTSAANALDSETNAAASASSALSSAQTATTQASAASTSAANALVSETKSQQYLQQSSDIASEIIQYGNSTLTIPNPYKVFCVNTGIVDDEGNPSFLILSGSVLKTSGSFDVTTAKGRTKTISDILSCSLSGLASGEYNIFINPVSKVLSVKKNKIYIGGIFPEGAVAGDYLLNTSKVPYDLEEKTSSGTSSGLNEVLTGTLTISASGGG